MVRILPVHSESVYDANENLANTPNGAIKFHLSETFISVILTVNIMK